MHKQTEPVTMWFDRRLGMRQSPIHGTGLFALEDVYSGERLMWVTGGIVYTREDWRSDKVRLAADQYNEEQLDDNLFIATPKALHYYVNHSCDPNMLNQIAWHDIRAGEEITTDYAYGGADPNYLLEPCQCGTALCRGRLTGNDWKLPELQERYRGYFTPHLERLIRQLAAQRDT